MEPSDKKSDSIGDAVWALMSRYSQTQTIIDLLIARYVALKMPHLGAYIVDKHLIRMSDDVRIKLLDAYLVENEMSQANVGLLEQLRRTREWRNLLAHSLPLDDDSDQIGVLEQRVRKGSMEYQMRHFPEAQLYKAAADAQVLLHAVISVLDQSSMFPEPTELTDMPVLRVSSSGRADMLASTDVPHIEKGDGLAPK